MPDEITPARAIVESEIRANGPITFARFMEIALYGEHGYYSNVPNPSADYATSPQMHPAFGALIAAWLFSAWRSLGEPQRFDVVELGAGDGGLATDILDAFSEEHGRSEDADTIDRFRRALTYRPLDIRPRGSARSTEELAGSEPIVGCVISNELLDAFPTHIFTIRNCKVLECYVEIGAEGALRFVEDEVSDIEISTRVGKLVSILPDGYRGEVNLRIEDWASNVAGILERGYVLSIDYGHERDALYHPSRTEGSLRCYRDHVLGQNPFRDVGLQDITSHVDFTAVDDALRDAGLSKLKPHTTQRDFLFDLGFGAYARQLRSELEQTRYANDDNRLNQELRALNSLVDTRGLGAFKVAQHTRDAPPISLDGLEHAPLFRLPGLTSRHSRFLPYD